MFIVHCSHGATLIFDDVFSLLCTIINVQSIPSSYGCHFYHGKALLLSSRFARMTFDWGLIMLIKNIYVNIMLQTITFLLLYCNRISIPRRLSM